MKNNPRIDDGMVQIAHIVRRKREYCAYSSKYRPIGTFTTLNNAILAVKKTEPRMSIHLHDYTGRVIKEIGNKETKVIDLCDKTARPKRRIRKVRVMHG